MGVRRNKHMHMKYWIGPLLAMSMVPFTASANEAATQDDFIDGEQRYNQFCTKCHAEDGSGSKFGKALKPFPARNHRAVAQLIGRDEFRRIITYGVAGTSMKSKRYTLDGLEIEAVIDYIKTFDYKADLNNGKKRFEQVCSKCHGIDGRANTGMGAKDLVYTKLDLIGITHTMRYGRAGTKMKSKRHQMTNADIADVANYVYALRYESDPANGKKLYADNCLSCHEAPGAIKLKGNAASKRKLTDLDDRLLDLRIRHGRHVRKAGKHITKLSADEVQDVMAYMRQSAK
jgi:cytochrome c oxidase cbb3-type subunit 3